MAIQSIDFDALTRGSFADQVAQQLLGHIVSQGLKPGTCLPSEQKLAEEFGVSQPVVREALRSLVGQHLIQTVNGKGAVVSLLSGRSLGLFLQRATQLKGQSIAELMEVRECLEGLGTRLERSSFACTARSVSQTVREKE